MTSETQTGEELLGGVNGNTAVIRVSGRGSFKSGPALKQFVLQLLETAPCWRVVVDMADCPSMDSTFMGVLAGIALKIRKASTPPVTMINLSPKTLSLLRTLGLDRLLETHEQGSAPAELLSAVNEVQNMQVLGSGGADRLTSVATMLNAHEDLVRASEENRKRFSDVIGCLGEDLRNIRADGS